MKALFLVLTLTVVTLAQEERSYPDVTINGQMQLQFGDDSLGSSSERTRRPKRNGIGAFPATDSLRFRRLRVIPTLHISPELDLVNETDFDPDRFQFDDYELTVLDLYLRYKFAEGHHLRFGQFKVPFGWEFFRSSRTLQVIERSDGSRQLFQRDLGIGVFGKTDQLEYGLAFIQGQGQGEIDRNHAKDVSGRVVFRLSPSLRWGVSGHWGTILPDLDGPVFPIRRMATEVHFEEGPLTLEGEFLYGDGYNLFSEADTQSRAFYLTGISPTDFDFAISMPGKL